MENKLKIFLLTLLVPLLVFSSEELQDKEALAKLIPGSGSYSREISTNINNAQEFFDQGLRFAWGFY